MSDTDHYEGTPGPTKGKQVAVTTWQAFEEEFSQRAASIFSMLPSNVSPEKFRNTAIAAVKQNPELLLCTPRTLFASITRAALDGIMPDGREGVIGPYNVNVAKRGAPDKWEKQAQWQPMFFGLRKRARELDGLLVDAQVVYEKDHFVWHQGDEPRIEHTPAKLGTERGKLIGAYAIFKREDKTIIAREVMDEKAINDVRAQSKQPDGLMWKKFTTEAWRKTVGRRGFKSVPVSDDLQAIIKRDDEANFEFNQEREHAAALVPPPAPPPAPALEDKQQIPMAAVKTEVEPVAAKKTRGKAKEKAAEPAPEPPPEAATERFPASWNDYLDMQLSELRAEEKPAMQSAIRETVADAVQGATERGEISRDEAEAIMEKWEELSKDA